MEIEWLGGPCFRIKASGMTFVCDPFDAQSAYRADVPACDVVMLSRVSVSGQDPGTLNATRKLLRRPGEFELGGVFITGIKTYRDAEKGAIRGTNTVYRFKGDGINLCCLGSLGHVPTSDQASSIGDADVLLVPVGGDTLTPAAASETVSDLEPKIIIPVPYGATADSRTEAVAKFIKELGLAAPEPVRKLAVSMASLGEAARVVLLEPVSA